MLNKSRIKISSNRSFGLVFFFVFFILGSWPLISGGQIRIWSLVIAVIFLSLGLLNSRLLTPLNRLWFKFGMLLGAVISPIVMGVIFFLVVTPIGFFMRLAGKDFLRIKYSKKNKSYWIKRGEQISSMKQQF